MCCQCVVDYCQPKDEDGGMPLALSDSAGEVAASLEEAHGSEDVERYVQLFDAGATWITSRGRLIVGRGELHRYLARVMPGGLAGGSVSYRVAATVSAGDAVVVIDQEYRTADGALKPEGGRHRHTYVVAGTGNGWTIVAGQNTTMAVEE